jgi:hypothetical protein
MAHAMYRVSPAPISTASSTYSAAPMGCVAARMSANEKTSSLTTGSVVKIGTYTGRSRITRTARTSPLPSPHATTRRATARTRLVSEAPMT